MKVTVPIFGEKEYSESNYTYRWFDKSIFEQYYDNIYKCQTKDFQKVLDIGCGTGQFAINIALKLPDANI